MEETLEDTLRDEGKLRLVESVALNEEEILEEEEWDQQQQKQSYETIIKENSLFEEYYGSLGFLKDDEDRKYFMETLRRPLPTTFRITGTRSCAMELKGHLKSHYVPMMSQSIVFDGDSIQPPRPLPWYPHELGWHFDCSRKAFRRCTALKMFHQFLVTETKLGNISRQEAVSMLPPMLLDVRPGHKLLDMCAAPGSKTAHLIEALHGELPGVEHSVEPYPFPQESLVIANDVDSRRCHTLVHQTKRLQSPALMVTNYDAASFPNLTYGTIMESQEIQDQHESPTISKLLLFDRILCDVPCSGDGTLRKNILLWKTWNPMNAIGLHRLQVNILSRACALLQADGRLVYSTCSFNPVENEAVVGTILRRYQDTFELVDVTEELKGLVRRSGLTKWHVIVRDGMILKSYLETPEKLKSKIFPSMFAPPDVDKLNLERCLRLVPQDQDTGGFFIAVLRKKPSIDPTSTLKNSSISSVITEITSDGVEVSSLSNNMQQVKEPPVKKHCRDSASGESLTVMPRDSEDLLSIKKFYGIGDEFPWDQLIVRSDIEKKRTMYFVSRPVQRLLVFTQKGHRPLKIVHTGVKLFARNEAKGDAIIPYRICQEGMSCIRSFVTKRNLWLTKDEVMLLLRDTAPFFTMFSQEMANDLSQMELGCVLLNYRPTRENVVTHSESYLTLAGWRGHQSLSLLISKEERQSLRNRLENSWFS